MQKVQAQLLLPVSLLLTLGAGVVAYLLTRFPYDGMYGQDAYAYFGQAEAWWRELKGEPQLPNALYSSQEFRWPVGYHLHVILGFYISGVSAWGGWVLNLGMTIMVPIMVYIVAIKLWPKGITENRLYAATGAAFSAALLLLSGTFTRMGLSLMADVPALFWAMLGYVCALNAWPLAHSTSHVDKQRVWALCAGGTLGLAVLTRYGALLLLQPLIVYLTLLWRRHMAIPHHLGWAALAFAAALTPQALYLLTHEAGAGYSAFLSDWSITNITATSVQSTDGSAHYPYPMLFFFAILPLLSASAGFLSYLLVPAFAIGLWTLVRQNQWPTLALLIAWWLIPALVLSGTPYQAHRFVILYLPALLIPIGIGIGLSLKLAFTKAPTNLPRYSLTRLLSFAVITAALLGAWRGWEGTRDWMSVHSSFKNEEKQVLSIARETMGKSENPRIVAFGLTAALHYYTGWPVLDIYNNDTTLLEQFLNTPAPSLVVVPESAMLTQWAGTPTGERWLWLKAQYRLELEGKAGEYSVYSVSR